MLELPDCLKKRLAFNVSDCSSYLYDSDPFLLRRISPVKSTFYFIRNMRNDLNGSSSIVSASRDLHSDTVFEGDERKPILMEPKAIS